MSIELEVRSDDKYTRLAPRARVVAILRQQPWAAESKSENLLVYARDGCHVEITLGRPEAPLSSQDQLAWLGFRVPAGARLESAERSLEVAMALATELGWRVFDPQRDDYVPPSELEPGPSLREAVGRLATEARAAGRGQFLRRTMRRLGRQSAMGVLVPVVLGFGAAVVVGWVLRFSVETRPWLFVSLTLLVGLGLVGLDVVTDVLGEIHQESERSRR